MSHRWKKARGVPHQGRPKPPRVTRMSNYQNTWRSNILGTSQGDPKPPQLLLQILAHQIRSGHGVKAVSGLQLQELCPQTKCFSQLVLKILLRNRSSLQFASASLACPADSNPRRSMIRPHIFNRRSWLSAVEARSSSADLLNCMQMSIAMQANQAESSACGQKTK